MSNSHYSLLTDEAKAKLADMGVIKRHYNIANRILCPEKVHTEYPFTKVNLMFYVDMFGDYFSNRTKVALICCAIHDALPAQDQKAMMSYIMESE